jgi:hypothetical protein
VFKLFRRFFWLLLGFAAGWASSRAVTRRMRRTVARYVPSEVRERWSGNMRAAVDEGRAAMRAREAELKGARSADTGK